jgi:hypothetical protein
MRNGMYTSRGRISVDAERPTLTMDVRIRAECGNGEAVRVTSNLGANRYGWRRRYAGLNEKRLAAPRMP